MKYWFTTHWPPRKDEPADCPPSGVWIPDGKLRTVDGMNVGDLVFVYQCGSGPTRVIQNANGTTTDIPCWQGKQGVVGLYKITSKPYQPDFAEPEGYTGNKKRWWRYCATIESINSAGFISRRDAARLLGLSEDYYFRGFGTNNAGVKEIDKRIFNDILTEFVASSDEQTNQVAANTQNPAFAPGGEGPVHCELKERIARDPAGVLNEPGLALWKLEYLLPTSDKIDIVLKDMYGRFVVVEVEVDCSTTEIVGPLQCMKYQAMIAYMFQRRPDEVRSFLAARSIASNVRDRCSKHRIETFVLSQ